MGLISRVSSRTYRKKNTHTQYDMTDNSNNYQCHFCYRSYKTRLTLVRHQSKWHVHELEANKFCEQCLICGMEFTEYADYDKHIFEKHWELKTQIEAERTKAKEKTHQSSKVMKMN